MSLRPVDGASTTLDGVIFQFVFLGFIPEIMAQVQFWAPPIGSFPALPKYAESTC
jgi:hypothetical protein